MTYGKAIRKIRETVEAVDVATEKTPSPSRKLQVAPNHNAEQLFTYMTFRALQEGQEHTLTVEFYEEQLRNGVRSFFGVVVGPTGLVRDVQQPELFADWTDTQSPKAEACR
jgi:hypothetical protein